MNYRKIQELADDCIAFKNIINYNYEFLGSKGDTLSKEYQGKIYEHIAEWQKKLDTCEMKIKLLVGEFNPKEFVSEGAGMIAMERLRQTTQEGHTDELDDKWTREELARAAACYTIPDYSLQSNHIPAWPWHSYSYKPCPNDRIKELTKAGALIAAEIDRLLRIRKKENK
jgi:hypothetical protein